MESSKELFRQLSAPFTREELLLRVLQKSKVGDKALPAVYIDARRVMQRLDDVMGPENWKVDYIAGASGGVLCRLQLRINGEWISKADGAANTDVEAVKGGMSKALVRAAVCWGIGRYLYAVDTSKWAPVGKYGFEPAVEKKILDAVYKESMVMFKQAA